MRSPWVGCQGIRAVALNQAWSLNLREKFTIYTAVSSDAAPASARGGGETVTNPYGLEALWAQGDFVAKGTLLILILLSAASWYVIITKLYEQQKLRWHGREAQEKFWTAEGRKAPRRSIPTALFTSSPNPVWKPEVVRIDIEGHGVIFWNGEPQDGGVGALEPRLAASAAQAVQPELHVRPDRAVPYEIVVAAMAAIQRNRLTKIGLVGAE
ncbi:MAG: biopolymer transporter ExbD [Azoarcus sp.]|jgi:hypothetical protein|nr:biopolymer transporter ExbD [Azoarcus sp.]